MGVAAGETCSSVDMMSNHRWDYMWRLLYSWWWMMDGSKMMMMIMWWNDVARCEWWTESSADWWTRWSASWKWSSEGGKLQDEYKNHILKVWIWRNLSTEENENLFSLHYVAREVPTREISGAVVSADRFSSKLSHHKFLQLRHNFASKRIIFWSSLRRSCS
jgi:hypothetical protein